MNKLFFSPLLLKLLILILLVGCSVDTNESIEELQLNETKQLKQVDLIDHTKQAENATRSSEELIPLQITYVEGISRRRIITVRNEANNSGNLTIVSVIRCLEYNEPKIREIWWVSYSCDENCCPGSNSPLCTMENNPEVERVLENVEYCEEVIEYNY